MVIIQRKDKQKMSDMVEDILYTAGRLMTCVEDMEEMDEMGERRNYSDRYGMGMRDGGRYGMRGGYGMRDWEDDPMMERRRYRRY
jgi:hypothetical protein